VVLLGVQYLATLAFVYFDVMFADRAAPTQIGQLAWNIVTFREGGDLLLLYVMLIGMVPVLLEIQRRRYGWMVLAAGASLLFAWADFHPMAITFGDGKFPPALWQAVFMCGLFAGAMLPRYDRLGIRSKLAICGAACIAFGILFWGDYWSMLGLPALRLPLSFVKIPLNLGELLRYLTLVVGIWTFTDLIWPWLRGLKAVAFTATLGRSSLPVYVLHVFLIESISIFCKNWYGLGWWEMLFAPLAVAVLWGFAVGWQFFTGRGALGRAAPSHAVTWRPTPVQEYGQGYARSLEP